MTELTPPLIVCGAPGSATVPLAQALSVAGLFFGDRMRRYWGPGSFEDGDIAAFHEMVVQSREKSAGDQRAWSAPAREMLQRKFAGRPAWGWKDPRTALLLDLWDAVLPDAKWIFVFRRPAVVVWSLVHRSVFEKRTGLALGQALCAARAWQTTNRRILDFVRRHPERCVVLRAPDDFDAAGEALLHDAVSRWGTALRPVGLRGWVRPHLLKERTPRWIATLAAALPGVSSLERALDRHRSRGGGGTAAPDGHTPAPSPSRTVCVFVATVKREYSQTFVHDHLDRLPARTILLHQEGNSILTKDDLKLLTLWERLAAAILRECGNRLDAIRNRAVARFLRREGVDVVLIEFADQAGSVLAGAAAAGIPVIVHFHGFDAYRENVLDERRDDYRLLFRSAAAVVAVSHAMVQQLVRIGAPPEKIRYSPCGTDVSLFAGGDPAAAPPMFVAVGRFVDKKGPHLTVLAFRTVLDACPDARLVMVGDGLLLGACRTLAQQLALGEAVTFLGAQPHAEVLRALRGARAFVQHSMIAGGDSEGTPVAVVEASSCGVPVISTRHGGIPDVVIHGDTGFVVAEGDVGAMATHMITLARDPLLAAQMGRRARERVMAEFSMERSIGRLWQAIDDVTRVVP